MESRDHINGAQPKSHTSRDFKNNTMSLQSELNQLGNFEDVSYDASAELANGASAKSIFCNGWPAAKVVLEAIAAMIKNPLVKIIINLVIKAGDALSNKICN